MYLPFEHFFAVVANTFVLDGVDPLRRLTRIVQVVFECSCVLILLFPRATEVASLRRHLENRQ